MYWISIRLLSSFLFAIENIVDKKIADVTSNTTTALFLMNITKIPALIILWSIWYRDINITLPILLWTFGIGLISILAWSIYLRLLKHEDVSSVIPMYELSPIWALWLGYFLLKEVPNNLQFIAMAFLMAWAFVFAFKKSTRGWNIWKSVSLVPFFMVLVSSFSYSAINALMKYVIVDSNVETVFTLHLSMYVIFSVIWSSLNMKGAHFREIALLPKKTLMIATIWQWIGTVSHAIYTFAFTIGSLALASALGSVQALFVMLLSVILTAFAPSFLREKWDKSAAFQKLFWTILITLWVIIMYMVS
jgi:drug/metabolite transporter (DMT)-like permease